MTEAKFFDDTLADDMVRQTRERLRADDVRCALLDELKHLGSQKPSFTGHVADRNDRAGFLGELTDRRRSGESFACTKSLFCRQRHFLSWCRS